MSVFIPPLCDALQLPVTQGRIDWFNHWANGERTNALWNPFATTLPAPQWELSSNPWFNSFGPNGSYHVRNYKDLASGVAATAQTIRQTELPGDFHLIYNSLQQQRVLMGVAAVMSSTWGTVAFANELSGGWVPTGWTSDYVLAAEPAKPFTDAQEAWIRGAIDSSFGPILLLELQMILGIQPSTFSSMYDAAIAGVKARLLGAHHHTTGDVQQ